MRQSSIILLYAALTHRTSVLKFGGLPYISRPIRKIFAAPQTAAHAVAHAMASDSSACHVGGGVLDASRTIMTNALIGGMKLSTTASVESGLRAIGKASTQGPMIISMIGPISAWASLRSFTAAPAAANTAPKSTNVTRKNASM